MSEVKDVNVLKDFLTHMKVYNCCIMCMGVDSTYLCTHVGVEGFKRRQSIHILP